MPVVSVHFSLWTVHFVSHTQGHTCVRLSGLESYAVPVRLDLHEPLYVCSDLLVSCVPVSQVHIPNTATSTGTCFQSGTYINAMP